MNVVVMKLVGSGITKSLEKTEISHDESYGQSQYNLKYIKLNFH